MYQLPIVDVLMFTDQWHTKTVIETVSFDNQTPVLCHVAICTPIGYCLHSVCLATGSTNRQRQDWSIRSAFMNGYIPRTNLIPLYGAFAASSETASTLGHPIILNRRLIDCSELRICWSTAH